MSSSTLRVPLKPRPNSDAWLKKAKVPGSWSAAFCSTGISSLARSGSTDAAPRKVWARLATKKKRRILGGPPGSASGPVTDAMWGSSAFSISLAMAAVVARL